MEINSLGAASGAVQQQSTAASRPQPQPQDNARRAERPERVEREDRTERPEPPKSPVVNAQGQKTGTIINTTA